MADLKKLIHKECENTIYKYNGNKEYHTLDIIQSIDFFHTDGSQYEDGEKIVCRHCNKGVILMLSENNEIYATSKYEQMSCGTI